MELASQIFYVATFVWIIGCIYVGQRSRHINLWDCVTISAKGKKYTDPKKVAYIGVFLVMAVSFVYFAVTKQLTDWFCTTFVGAFVVGKWLGDREQRLAKQDPPK